MAVVNIRLILFFKLHSLYLWIYLLFYCGFHVLSNVKTVGLQIRLEPTRQVVKPGDNAEITCTATGEEPIEITWMAVGRELPTSVTIRGGHIHVSLI